MLSFLVVLIAAAPPRLCVAPPHGVSAELAVELAEQERAAALRARVPGGLLVMSKKTFDAARKAKQLEADCADSDCDVGLAKKLETDLVLTTNVIKTDGTRSMVVTKLFRTSDGTLLATKTVETSSLGEVMEKVGDLTVQALTEGLKTESAPMSSVVGQQAPKREPVDTTTIIREGRVAMGEDGDVFGRNGNLQLYGDRLVFQMTGLNINNIRITIMLRDVTSTSLNGDEVIVQMESGKRYRFTADNNSGWRGDIEAAVAAAR